MPDEYLADISTAEALPSVRIDGTKYALRIDCGSREWARFRRLARRFDELSEIDEPSEEEEAKLTDLLPEMARLALDAPEEVHARLTDLHRLRIVEAFGRVMGQAVPFAGANGVSTPGSSDSTTEPTRSAGGG